MTSEESAAIARALYESFNERDFDRIDAVAVMGAWVDLRPFDMRLGLREALQNWATAFPNGHVEIQRIDAKPDHVVVEYVGRGTHRGPLALPSGTIQPTYRTVAVQFVDTLEIDEAEEKIVRGESLFDANAFFTQLGISPPPPRSHAFPSLEVDWGY